MAIESHQPEIVEEDLWGRICRDYFEGQHTSFITRRDDGLAETNDLAPYFRTELPETEVKALEKARGHVLDVGCGPGPDVLWFQRRGVRVTGIDASAGAVEVAEKRGAHDVRVMSLWEIGRMGETFDTVLFMGNNMGLAGSLEKTGELLELLRETTSDGALLIGHTVDPTATTNPSHLAYHRQNEAAGRYRGQVRLRKEYEGRVSPWWDLVFFERDVLVPLCERHGWRCREVIPWGASYFLIAEKATRP